MPDISMCDNQSCPMRHECYRFMAVPNPYRQAWFIGVAPNADGSCEFKLPIFEGSRSVRTRAEVDRQNAQEGAVDAPGAMWE